eukprot:381788-Rhodomonas_salina.2
MDVGIQLVVCCVQRAQDRLNGRAVTRLFFHKAVHPNVEIASRRRFVESTKCLAGAVNCARGVDIVACEASRRTDRRVHVWDSAMHIQGK